MKTIGKFILGRKISMTQVFDKEGVVHPVTVVEVSPIKVSQVKTKEKDGYTAIQLTSTKGKIETKREYRTEDTTKNVGDALGVSLFNEGDEIEVSAISKGKGFQGVVKRHGFHGSPKSHGHKDQMRMPGSIGAGGPQRVFKGMRMGGRTGGDQVTVKNLEIVQVDQANNIIAVKGALPGARGSVVAVRSTKGTIWQK